MKTKLLPSLTGNQLKILALVAMTFDHVGLQLFPEYDIFRYIGRLAFPIFAYMIAEGAKYTKNRLRYFGQMFGLGVICQLVYFFAMDSLYQCILITFSFSVILIYALDYAIKKKNIDAWILFAMIFIATVFLVEFLPSLLKGTDYCVDYGIWGVLTPVLVFAARGHDRSSRLSLLRGRPLSMDGVFHPDPACPVQRKTRKMENEKPFLYLLSPAPRRHLRYRPADIEALQRNNRREHLCGYYFSA